MKTISVILIVAYLLLPALCFGHPCDVLSAESRYVAASDTPNECPFSHDTDECETTCCCAGHESIPKFIAPLAVPRISALLSYDPVMFLPQIIAQIFVPPQNLS